MLKAPSLRSVTQYFEALERKGLIRRKRHKKRGVELVEIFPSEEMVSVPVFASAGCGSPSVIAERTFDEFVTVSKKVVPNKKKERLYVIRAVGKSMEDAGIKDGDLVLVEQTGHAENNDLVVVIIEDTAVIKKISFANNVIILNPVTIDPEYRPMIMRRDFNIFGKVIQVINVERNNDYQIIPIQ